MARTGALRGRAARWEGTSFPSASRTVLTVVAEPTRAGEVVDALQSQVRHLCRRSSARWRSHDRMLQEELATRASVGRAIARASCAVTWSRET